MIPAYNPNGNLNTLCSELLRGGIEHIVVTNDGSETSESAKVFRLLASEGGRVTVLHHKTNRGKGAALKTAFRHVLENTEAEGVVTADADGQHRTADIVKCARTLSENPNALVLGCRGFNWAEMPLRSKIGNRHTIRLFYKKTGVHLTDTQTGLRAMSRSLMEEAASIEGDGFDYEMNMLVNFAYRHEIMQVWVKSVYNDETRRGSHFRPVRDSLRVMRALHKATREARGEK